MDKGKGGKKKTTTNAKEKNKKKEKENSTRVQYTEINHDDLSAVEKQRKVAGLCIDCGKEEIYNLLLCHGCGRGCI
jgi:hypothetical protein